MFHTPLPRGPAGQFSWHVPFADMVMGYGKNQKAAKDFLRWFHTEKIYEQWWVTQQGFSVGPTKMWENHKLWQEDPIMLPFRSAAESGHFAGYAGPSLRPAAEVISKYIISDMYAKAVQGMAPEDAVKSAHGELVKIYA
jgi:multiple sugar transport system substrate-binding protein